MPFCLFATLLLTLFNFPARAQESVALPIDKIQFSFESQDGDLNYSCAHKYSDASTDYAVTCARADTPRDVWKFTVHLRLFKHEKPTTPKLGYELLYWVTDEQLPSGQTGKFTGSTIWMNLNEATPLHSIDAGQDVEDTWVLRLHLDLQ